MMDGYHRIFNNFALQEVARTVDVPQPALGIGFAEKLDFTPLMIRYEPVFQAPVFSKIKTREDAGAKGQGDQVFQNQFPNRFYVGEALGGF